MKATKAYTVPVSSADITLDQFQQVMALDDMEDKYSVIPILTDIDKDYLHAIKKGDLDKIYEKCIAALFDKDQPTHTRWKHKGVTYGLHPQFASMTLGEITNLESHMNKEEDFHKGMAVAYREITTESKAMDGLYDIVPYEGTSKTAEFFKEIPLSYFYGLRLFFLTTGKELDMISRRYSIPAGTVKT